MIDRSVELQSVAFWATFPFCIQVQKPIYEIIMQQLSRIHCQSRVELISPGIIEVSGPIYSVGILVSVKLHGVATVYIVGRHKGG